jgi:nitrate/nitrite transport system substrate-binding protein
VFTGRYADGLGQIRNVPGRADFDPFPYQSMAVWILTQLKRWGYLKGDVDYRQVAEKVFLATEARTRMTELGLTAPKQNYASHTIMGKPFDPARPDVYLSSFSIRRS